MTLAKITNFKILKMLACNTTTTKENDHGLNQISTAQGHISFHLGR